MYLRSPICYNGAYEQWGAAPSAPRKGCVIVLNLGHRGFSGKYPENTMLAYRKAVAAGANGVELDVQLTKDGEVVVIHDERVDRTTDGQGFVRDFTLADLRKLDASYLYKQAGVRNPVPTFEEYCEWAAAAGCITNVELKNGVYPYPALEEKTLALLRKYHLEQKVIISSFNHFSVLRMKELAPDLEYGLLEESWVFHPGAYAAALGVQCYHPFWGSLTDDTVADLKAHHLKINTFTVNDEAAIRSLLAKGVDCVIGNFPDLTAAVLAG